MTKSIKPLLNDKNYIAALAIDQRGALKRLLGEDAKTEDLEQFKVHVSEELTPYASSILLDPEYGLPATKVRAKNAGLLLAYEKTGYDASEPGRLPDLLNVWSVKRLKEAGADAVKLLVYVDIDEDKAINDQKEAFVERVGAECVAEGLPLFLEIVSYDANNADSGSEEYAKVKAHKVNEAMKKYSEPRFNVDVLKVEVPVNMNYVEGFGEKALFTKEEAAQAFKEQAASTNLPYIYLSAGVSADLFQKTLYFAKESGSTFNGVLCGRATWRGATDHFSEGEDAVVEWFRTEGKANIESLNKVLDETANPVK
ncbi:MULTISPECIES: tagatose-bisphosphate aldolase [Staphylococcus]|uniref:Tagatose 1,6-diphosphate aldolase n=1 Tax=Staphylococcus simulans UMC-CNS-990 TaxID=1405498 RepID=A0ABP2YTM7_STASI|nr:MULTISPECIES: tagatose-bisphosphate aldolase [Staphylococcus]ERS92865.1 tagatose-bisphosphate aldolase [Staphylococcus simulans UMC-CNS-990]MCE5024770.1 tagatose-bisphosphate aldolase [Staphylococcus simulans]MCE5148405.1 tagatose-bisphosphate aldolase [Staphylococcus simulans]MDK7927350.1 tagatose-bisphosphate aldolase [Staphylococcus simulans]MDK8315984.1 tagatose-bisphosphate aldolase [Staphylococcus simulans]